MRVIFIGPPGSGKGTQAKLLGQRERAIHYSTGDVLRDAIAHETPEGKRAEPFVASGRLVPDEVVNEIVNARFRGDDRPQRFVMDGYPRTLAQAESFERTLHAHGLTLEGVVFLKVPDAEIIKRLGGRWTCPNPACKATFHTLYAPPAQAGICDNCGTALTQRDDDRPEIIAKRLRIFHDRNRELLQYYQRSGLLIEVPGQGDVETIYQEIVRALQAHNIS